MRYLRTVQDYSTTPLSIKLGIKEDSTLAHLYAPKSFSLEIPSRVDVKLIAQGHVDAAVAGECVRPKGRRISAPCTTISPSIATTGAGGWFVVVVRAPRRRISSLGPAAAFFLASRSAKTLNLKPAIARSLKKSAGVCSAAATTCPASS